MKIEKVMCVDDDPIALLLSKLVLSKAEFSSQVITAANGEIAIEYLERPAVIEENQNSKTPLVILLDLNMPVMDGWEFLEQFSTTLYRQYYETAKVILLSSSIDPNDIERSKEFSMVVDFLPKPLTKEMLQIILNRVNE